MNPQTVSFDPVQLLYGIIFGFILVTLSYRLKFLSLSGSIATFILAVLVFGFGGWQFTIPILVFFILSSLLSKAGKKSKLKFRNTFEKSGTRDFKQVLANGGLAAFFLVLWIFSTRSIFYQLYLVALASATADTWATELGVLSKSKPRLISTFKLVEPGVSGGVSILGTVAAFAGSYVLAVSAIYWLADFRQIFFIAVAGFFGAVIDSYFGALVQGQYRCAVCQAYTEKTIHCQTKTIQTRGFSWINNDRVNIFSAAIAALIYLIISFV